MLIDALYNRTFNTAVNDFGARKSACSDTVLVVTDFIVEETSCNFTKVTHSLVAPL